MALVIFVTLLSVLSVAENPRDGTETTESISILDLVYAGVFPYTLDQDDLARRNSWVDRDPEGLSSWVVPWDGPNNDAGGTQLASQPTGAGDVHHGRHDSGAPATE